MIPEQEINRMRWASRRGMLELDLVLEPFVTARYGLLDEVDRRRFQQLMLSESVLLPTVEYCAVIRAHKPTRLKMTRRWNYS